MGFFGKFARGFKNTVRSIGKGIKSVGHGIRTVGKTISGGIRDASKIGKSVGDIVGHFSPEVGGQISNLSNSGENIATAVDSATGGESNIGQALLNITDPGSARIIKDAISGGKAIYDLSKKSPREHLSNAYATGEIIPPNSVMHPNNSNYLQKSGVLTQGLDMTKHTMKVPADIATAQKVMDNAEAPKVGKNRQEKANIETMNNVAAGAREGVSVPSDSRKEVIPLNNLKLSKSQNDGNSNTAALNPNMVTAMTDQSSG